MVDSCFQEMPLRERQSNAKDQPQVREWVLNNRGIFERIAMKVRPVVTGRYVQQVAYGLNVRSTHPVLLALNGAGWPGVKK